MSPRIAARRLVPAGLALAVALGAGLATTQDAGRALAAPEPDLPRLERSIRLGPVDGRIDHLALDAKETRVAVAAVENGSLEVVDLAKGAVAGRVANLHGPKGILWLADADRIVVACGGDGTVRSFGGKDLAAVASVTAGDDPDNLRLDAAASRIWVAAADGELVSIEKDAVGVRVALEGHPEGFQLASKGARAFVNVPDAKQVAVLDLAAGRVVATWKTGEANDNYPMALDEAKGRVYVGCRTPARLVVLDATSGKALQSVESSGDVDDLFLDREGTRLYLACGEGFLDVFDANAEGSWARTGRVPTAPGARTCVFSPASGRIYVAVPHRGTQPAEVRVFATRD